jgi:hypothetical protein
MLKSCRNNYTLFNDIGDHGDMGLCVLLSRLCGLLSAISAGDEVLHRFTLESHLHSTALACGADGCEVAQKSAGGFPPMGQRRLRQLDLVRSTRWRQKEHRQGYQTRIFSMVSLPTCQ